MTDTRRKMRITGKTPKGTPFTVELEGTSSLDCRAWVTCARLENEDMERHSSGLCYELPHPTSDGGTHCLRTCRGNVGIGLTSEEAARINSEYTGWLATLPAERAWRLHAHRDDLVATLRGARDDVRYRRDRWFESECKRGPLPDYDTDERVTQAQAELRAFDVAHPEVLSEIEAEAARAAKAHMWD